MPWVMVYVGLAVGGLAVLAAAGFRLWGDVRVLSREVTAASRRITEAVGALEAELDGRPPGAPVRDRRDAIR